MPARCLFGENSQISYTPIWFTGEAGENSVRISGQAGTIRGGDVRRPAVSRRTYGNVAIGIQVQEFERCLIRGENRFLRAFRLSRVFSPQAQLQLSRNVPTDGRCRPSGRRLFSARQSVVPVCFRGSLVMELIVLLGDFSFLGRILSVRRVSRGI